MTSIANSSTVQKARENGHPGHRGVHHCGGIRLRGEPITRSPKVVATISDSVQLARMVLDVVEEKGEVVGWHVADRIGHVRLVDGR